MEVSIVPFSIEKNEILSIYKLKIKLYDPKLYPPHIDLTLEDCQRALLNEYLDELETAIKNHLLLLSRIAGIKSVAQLKGSDEMDGDDSENKSRPDDDDDGDSDAGNDDGADDLGVRDQKRKQQGTDEIDYEDDSEEEDEERTPVAESQHELEQDENEDEEENMEEDMPKTSSDLNSEEEKVKPQAKLRNKSDGDITVHVACEGLYFEVHFNFTNEPHILLAQVCWVYVFFSFCRVIFLKFISADGLALLTFETIKHYFLMGVLVSGY